MALTKIDDRGLKTPIDLLDNEKIRLGTDNDLEIYHASGEDQIRGTGTKFEIRSPNLQLQNSAAEKYIVCTSDGSVDLYHDNHNVAETDAAGLEVGRTNATNAYITMRTSAGTAGFLFADSNTDIILMDREGHYFVRGTKDGQVRLFYDHVEKLSTTSAGVTVSGSLVCQDTGEYQVVLKDSNNTGNGAEAAIGFKGNDDATLGLVGFNYWGDGNLDIQNNLSGGTISFETHNGTAVGERMHIDANGVLWHGVAPTTHFTNRSAYFANGNHGDNWNYISITGSTSGGAGIVFGDSVGNNTGNYESLIAHDNNNNSLYLKTAQTAKGLEIKADGDVHVIDGNLSLASGHGIDFSANSDTGRTVSSNVLDDYEEGTWNPIVTAGITSPTYSLQHGHYTKVGNKVSIYFYLNLNGGTSTSATVVFGGLPFTAANTSMYVAMAGYNNGSASTIDNPIPIIFPNSSTSQYYKQENTGVATVTGTVMGNRASNLWWATYLV